MNIKCRVINQLMQLWCFLTLPCIIQTYFILQWTEKADESQAWMTPCGIPQSPSWTTWLIRSAGTLTGMEGWGGGEGRAGKEDVGGKADRGHAQGGECEVYEEEGCNKMITWCGAPLQGVSKEEVGDRKFNSWVEVSFRVEMIINNEEKVRLQHHLENIWVNIAGQEVQERMRSGFSRDVLTQISNVAMLVIRFGYHGSALLCNSQAKELLIDQAYNCLIYFFFQIDYWIK